MNANSLARVESEGEKDACVPSEVHKLPSFWSFEFRWFLSVKSLVNRTEEWTQTSCIATKNRLEEEGEEEKEVNEENKKDPFWLGDGWIYKEEKEEQARMQLGFTVAS